VKIRIHNSLALEHKNKKHCSHFLLNDNFLIYFPNSRSYFYSKKSNSYIGHLKKDGSLEENYFIDLTPFDLKRIKSREWKELK